MAHDDKTADDRDGGSLHACKDGKGEAFNIHLNETELTLPEAISLYRRRLSISQSEMAACFSIHRETYRRFEAGDAIQTEIVRPSLGELTQSEICYIYRRRKGLTQEEVSEQMGVTRYWIVMMEQGKASAGSLVKFWGNYAG